MNKKLSRSTLWALLLVLGFFVLAVFLTRHENEQDKQAEYDRSNVELFDMLAADSPLMRFGPEDVDVSRKWSILTMQRINGAGNEAKGITAIQLFRMVQLVPALYCFINLSA